MTAQWLNKELQRLVPHCKHQVNNYRLVEIALWELWKQGKDMQKQTNVQSRKIHFQISRKFHSLGVALLPAPSQGGMT